MRVWDLPREFNCMETVVGIDMATFHGRRYTRHLNFAFLPSIPTYAFLSLSLNRELVLSLYMCNDTHFTYIY